MWRITVYPQAGRVVRGGLQNPADLRKSATHFKRLHGYFGLSVWVGEGMTVKELVTIGQIPNGSVAIGWVEDFRNNGFSISLSGRLHHATVNLGPSIADTTLERFRDTFEEIIENPLLFE